MEASTKIYDELKAAGVDVLLDDRKDRAGVKFKDADLIGYPLRITVSKNTLESGAVELKTRKTGEAVEVAITDVKTAVIDTLNTL